MFNFLGITEDLVSQHNAVKSAYSEERELCFESCPENKHYRLEASQGIERSTSQHFTLKTDDFAFVQVLIGPKGQTLKLLQSQLNVQIQIRSNTGTNEVHVTGSQYSCFAVRLLLADIQDNLSSYKKRELVEIGQNKRQQFKFRDDLEAFDIRKELASFEKHLNKTAINYFLSLTHEGNSQLSDKVARPQVRQLLYQNNGVGQANNDSEEDSGQLSPPGAEYFK